MSTGTSRGAESIRSCCGLSFRTGPPLRDHQPVPIGMEIGIARDVVPHEQGVPGYHHRRLLPDAGGDEGVVSSRPPTSR